MLEESGNVIRFVLGGVSPAFANALRRAMIAEVPSMAIDDVIVIENSSVLYDEILAHRLGLIPIKTDLDAYVLPEECDCKSELGCARCRASFTIEAEATDHTITVYSGDLKAETDVALVSDRIPIVRLAPFQKLKLEAYARLGRGAEHAKWQPVSACAYKYRPRVTLHPENLSNPEEVMRWCPRDVYSFDQMRGISVKNEMNCTLCMDCVDHAVPTDAKKTFPVKIEGDETTFVFIVESTGVLPPRRILQEAARVLDRKANDLTKLLKAEVA